MIKSLFGEMLEKPEVVVSAAERSIMERLGRVNQLHKSHEEARALSLLNAKETGEELLELQALVRQKFGPRMWKKWCREHLFMSLRRAGQYMTFATRITSEAVPMGGWEDLWRKASGNRLRIRSGDAPKAKDGDDEEDVENEAETDVELASAESSVVEDVTSLTEPSPSVVVAVASAPSLASEAAPAPEIVASCSRCMSLPVRWPACDSLPAKVREAHGKLTLSTSDGGHYVVMLDEESRPYLTEGT
jgi:hypothetical protein